MEASAALIKLPIQLFSGRFLSRTRVDNLND